MLNSADISDSTLSIPGPRRGQPISIDLFLDRHPGSGGAAENLWLIHLLGPGRGNDEFSWRGGLYQVRVAMLARA